MDLVFLFWIIILICGISLSFILVKSILKAILFSLIITALIFGVFGFYIFNDVRNLKENFLFSENLVVLSDNNKFIAAYSIKNLSKSYKESFTLINSENMEEIKRLFNNNEIEKLEEDYYKIIIFEYSAFNRSLEDGIIYEIDIEEYKINRDQINEILNSKSPYTKFYNIFISKEAISKNEMMKKIGISEEEDIKGIIFAIMIKDLLKDDKITGVIEKFKNKEIIILPNTQIFTTIRILPSSLIKTLFEKADLLFAG